MTFFIKKSKNIRNPNTLQNQKFRETVSPWLYGAQEEFFLHQYQYRKPRDTVPAWTHILARRMLFRRVPIVEKSDIETGVILLRRVS